MCFGGADKNRLNEYPQQMFLWKNRKLIFYFAAL